MAYVKGMFDRGELAGEFVALVRFKTEEEAVAFASKVTDPEATVSVHEVGASGYDIDYHLHKLSLYPVIKETRCEKEETNG